MNEHWDGSVFFLRMTNGYAWQENALDVAVEFFRNWPISQFLNLSLTTDLEIQ